MSKQKQAKVSLPMDSVPLVIDSQISDILGILAICSTASSSGTITTNDIKTYRFLFQLFGFPPANVPTCG